MISGKKGLTWKAEENWARQNTGAFRNGSTQGSGLLKNGEKGGTGSA